MILPRRVRFHLQGREDCTQEEPVTDLAADQIGVLTLPAQSGSASQSMLP